MRFAQLPIDVAVRIGRPREVIGISASEPVNVCVFNFQLPEMKGGQFVEKFCSVTMRVPLVMISGNGDVSPDALKLVVRFIPEGNVLERSLVSEIIELLGGRSAIA